MSTVERVPTVVAKCAQDDFVGVNIDEDASILASFKVMLTLYNAITARNTGIRANPTLRAFGVTLWAINCLHFVLRRNDEHCNERQTQNQFQSQLHFNASSTQNTRPTRTKRLSPAQIIRITRLINVDKIITHAVKNAITKVFSVKIFRLSS